MSFTATDVGLEDYGKNHNLILIVFFFNDTEIPIMRKIMQ